MISKKIFVIFFILIMVAASTCLFFALKAKEERMNEKVDQEALIQYHDILLNYQEVFKEQKDKSLNQKKEAAYDSIKIVNMDSSKLETKEIICTTEE